MRKSSLLLSLMLAGLMSFAQVIDSLKSVLPLREGKERLDVLLELSYEYLYINPEIASVYAMQVYEIADEQQDTIRLMRAFQRLGIAYRRLGKTDSAIQVLQKLQVMAEAKHDTVKLVSALNLTGIALLHLGSYDQSLKNHFHSLVLAEKTRDSVNVASNLNNIGIVYYKLKDYSKAIVYFRRCLSLGVLRGNVEFQHQLNLNISASYAYLENYNQALDYVNVVIKQCPDKCSAPTMIMTDFNLGVIHFGMKRFDKAEKFFLQSYERAKKYIDARLQMDNLIYLAQIAIHRNLPANAITFLTQSEKLIDEGTELNLEKIKVYNEFFRAYRLLNDFTNVAVYQQKYIDLKERVYDEELTNNLMKVEAEYMEKENLEKIKAQSEVLTLRQEVIDRQRWVNVLSVLVILSLVIILINVFQQNRQRRLINDKLELKVKERTKELEAQQIELAGACRERDLLINRTALEISESVATIKGLYNLGRNEHNEKDQWLLGGVEKISRNLNSTLTALKSSKSEDTRLSR
jgi:tetratricopeptide (TPR) repeat protein